MTGFPPSWHYLGARLEASLDRLHRLPATEPVQAEEVIERAAASLGRPGHAVLAESALAEVQRLVGQREAGDAADGMPAPIHNADLGLARVCYGLCRLLVPATVVETGVANGVTSAFLLAALEENGTGALHSVDLPPPDADPASIGRLVPDGLRGRWTLHRGASKDVLPGLASRLGPVALFVHDSRHTYRNVSRELRTVHPVLARPAAVVVDDAQRHSAAHDFAREAGAASLDFVAEPVKGALFAVALLAP